MPHTSANWSGESHKICPPSDPPRSIVMITLNNISGTSYVRSLLASMIWTDCWLISRLLCLSSSRNQRLFDDIHADQVTAVAKRCAVSLSTNCLARMKKAPGCMTLKILVVNFRDRLSIQWLKPLPDMAVGEGFNFWWHDLLMGAGWRWGVELG